MALTEYNQKRSFNKTPEPTGGKPSATKLAFVVQKHHASHLHYDFRLEMRGVLKSWAVPKGPSMKATEKRLAMLVEDHPFDYKDFEGNIPEGNYGAGSVIIWDEGWYEPAETIKGKKAQEHELLKQFYSGALKIKLHGKKLKGVFTLVKNTQRGETSWLLAKAKDKDALTTDIALKDKSVVSGKTVDEIAQDANAKQWESNRSANGGLKGENKKLSANALKSLIRQGRKSAMPSKVSPMLCTLVKEAFSGDDWLFEIKWDGYRLISRVQKNKVEMLSRSGLDYTSKYPPLAKALKQLKHDVILDGEAVVFNQEGKPDFDSLQLYNGHDTPITYCAFDILWIDGYDLMDMPLVERKEILQTLLSGNQVIRYSEHFDDGLALYHQMQQLNLEGMVAKKRNSEYQPGNRGRDWVKIPTRKRQEFVIGGWAESDKARSFRSLLFGAYNAKGEFEWIGRSGGGYKEKEMPGILKQLKAIEIEESPFVNRVLDTKGAISHWVKPQLVANFEFATWTKTGRIRKPATFLGFRKDKKAKDVVREIAVSTEAIDSAEDITTETEAEHAVIKTSRKKSSTVR